MPSLETPILFLVFNRPALTARVFESIREQRPTRLFVAADGPRPERAGEAEIVQQTREIATRVDWPCEVKTLFRETNLGCGSAVSGAITWFFQQVEEGIILEDDCLAHPDFFPFCQSLLERYRNEPKVATIAGTFFLPDELTHKQSHHASKYFQMWGWATWRRTWQHYDFELKGLSDEDWGGIIRKQHPIEVEAAYWNEILRSLKAGLIDTWDFQVFFSCWRIGGNHIMPGRNLVSNIGFGPEATHTNFAGLMAELSTHPLSVGREAVPLTPNPRLDNIIFYLRFLESMKHTWWLDQVLAPDRKLSDARAELTRKDRLVRQLEREVAEKRRQLLAATRALTTLTS